MSEASHATGNELDANFTSILIQSLDYLIGEAENSKLAVPARIIRAARSDILNWASYAYSAEDQRERFLKSVAGRDGLLVALDLISKYAAVRDTELKKLIYESLSNIGKGRPCAAGNGAGDR
jgi:hypothetical protein